ncbi:MAG: sensor histidine kinase [Salibacteraceae bacterium]
MNIYSKKQLWKRILVIVALIIVGVSLWYTNGLVQKIAEEERQKVELWAEAIQKKANLVKVTGELFEQLGEEETKKVKLWVEATEIAVDNDNTFTDLTFISSVLRNNTTVPVILVDDEGNFKEERNLDWENVTDSARYIHEQLQFMALAHTPIPISYPGDFKEYLYYKDSRIFSDLKNVFDDLQESFISEVVINSASVPVILINSDSTKVIGFGNVDSSIIKDADLLEDMLASMADENEPLKVDYGDNSTSVIYYSDSFLLTQLKLYPIFQFAIIGLFMFVAYLMFSTARRVEQNQVWVGMSKETAHQLGTPLSSLLAWMELLKDKIDPSVSKEIDKDLSRLLTITDRFSKIGSTPVLEPQNVAEILGNAMGYMKTRSSSKVKFTVNVPHEKNIMAKLNVQLFEWVIENLCKNAIDAMGGSGSITADVSTKSGQVIIDISDTGKGIPPGKLKTVFEPGYTTKKRGWGLGLSLTKRIIDIYHSGKIFVKRSEVNKGTTFRIVLNQ